MNYFLQGFGIVVGVTFGVIAGTLVTVLINYLKLRSYKKERIEYLKFELNYNIEKVNSFLEELRKYRDSVNGDALHKYYGYFELSKLVYPIANSMYVDGSLYKLFDTPNELVTLQKAFSSYHANEELDFNNKIKENMGICETDGWGEKKPDIVVYINFWENRFNEDIDIFRACLQKISGE